MAIALAYFAIPLTMAIVLRDRRDDIPYPWLWLLFVTFIVACGVTHLAHARIKDLPSPFQQQEKLQKLVLERTKQKDMLIREIHHRIGNQLQVVSSLINIEERKTEDRICREALDRIKVEVSKMAEEHSVRSIRDYLDEAERRYIALPDIASGTQAFPTRPPVVTRSEREAAASR